MSEAKNQAYFNQQSNMANNTVLNADGNGAPMKLSATEVAKTKTTIGITTGALATVGNIAGWVYCFKNKKGFWAYVGYGLLGGLVGASLGALITLPLRVKLANNEQLPDNNTTADNLTAPPRN